jgi:predicted metal-binding transcription factor (methanogenesis marker protein 9)
MKKPLKITGSLLDNDSVNTPEEACASNNRKFIAEQRISKVAFFTIEGMCFLRGPCKVVIKNVTLKKNQLSEVERFYLKKNLFELVVEFWRWQSKVTEKKWQETNRTVQTRLHM